ncbi:peptidase domain-containing ABC transporter [uncultured Bacteroides sp.]|uniref:peptidase domain-containing ABC transporter n=1 Tax=uncultured Bacteroides sp. TaxID=162156 RepID=UPI00280AB677|nr:peptidase domain-containing ABC transporter [uncultured Bacteroides sp.]
MKVVRQRDSMQCGVACLAMISNLYGKKISLTETSNYCHAITSGVSLKGICDGAKAIGLNSWASCISINKLSRSNKPCILHWNQKHFVVLYKIKGERKFYVADPGKGLIKYYRDEFERHWISTSSDGENKGIAMFFEPTTDFYKEKKCIEEKRSFKFLANYILEYRRYFMQIFFSLLFICLLQLVMPFLTQGIVDLGIANKDVKLIWTILLGELAIVIGKTSTDFIRRWLLLHISMRINISLISDFFIKLLKLSMSFFEIRLMGDLLQRMNDHSRVQLFLTNQLLGVMFTFFSFVVFGSVLFFYNKVIFEVFLLGSAAYGLWIAYFLKRRKLIDYELFEWQAINKNKTYQFITSIQEIKLQDCEKRRRWEWEDTQADLFNVQMKSLKLQQTQEAGSVFINEVKNIFITVLTATAVINGQITLGTMLAIQYIVGQLNSPVENLMSFAYYLQDLKISLDRINEIHQAENEEDKGGKLDSFDGQKEIRIGHIDFKYDPHSMNNTLNDISFTIPEGKITAIVGASGSGKTTLMKLMLAYYPVMSGSIRIGGHDVKDYNLKWWRRQCGVVMQEGVIFSESIARNIAVSDGTVDEVRLEKAAKIACIHDLIMSLPLKYNTKIGRDGMGLSLGQRQRILIARAVYKNPDFIFLDEATNSLDAKNEREIVDNLHYFYKGKTVVIVAHRLSTIKNADLIIVLDHGRIAESGVHTVLIEKRGLYYNLIKNQLELGN